MPAPSGVVSDADELVNLEERGGVCVFIVVVRRPAAPRPLGLLLDLGLDLEDVQDVPMEQNKKSCPLQSQRRRQENIFLLSVVASKTGVTTKDPAWLTTGTRMGFQAPPLVADVEATDPCEAAIFGDK